MMSLLSSLPCQQLIDWLVSVMMLYLLFIFTKDGKYLFDFSNGRLIAIIFFFFILIFVFGAQKNHLIETVPFVLAAKKRMSH